MKTAGEPTVTDDFLPDVTDVTWKDVRIDFNLP